MLRNAAAVTTLTFLLIILAGSGASAFIPVFSFLNPISGDVVSAGSTCAVSWSPGPTTTEYKLWVSYDGKLTWKALNDGAKIQATAYDWAVPPLTKSKTRCWLKLAGYDMDGNKVNTIFTGPFTVGALSLLSPASGAVIPAGSIAEVAWQTYTAVPNAGTILSYTLDGGATWKKAAAYDGNPGGCLWTAPLLSATTAARLRVQLVDGAGGVVAAASVRVTLKVTPMSTARVKGRYLVTNLESDTMSPGGPKQALASFLEVNLDGAGGLTVSSIVTSGENFSDTQTYSVSANGEVTIPGLGGIVSRDGGMVVLAQTRRGTQSMAVGIKASTGLDNSVLLGSYAVASLRLASDATAGTADLVNFNFYGDGSADVSCLMTSDPSGCWPGTIEITYNVASDGTFTDNQGHIGVVRGDGEVFTLLDYILAGPNDPYGIIVGARRYRGPRRPISLPLTDANLLGKYLVANMGYDSDWTGVWTDIMRVSFNGKGAGRVVNLARSLGPLQDPFSITYDLMPDGSLIIDPLTSNMAGLMAADGQFFFFVNIDPSGSEMLVTGLKQTK